MKPYWHGLLCAETHDEIADRMRDVLGEHYFTLVLCNSYDADSHRFSAVEVHPSQWLRDGIRTDATAYDISWTTPRLVMGVHSNAKTQAEAREDRPHNYVHVRFEPDYIEIDHFAPAGYRLLWILAVERHDREET